MHETNVKIGSHGETKLKVKKEKRIWNGKPSLKVSIKTEGTQSNDWYEIPRHEPIFEMLEALFEAEDLRYPKDEGYEGRDYLFKAIKDIWRGKSVKEVLRERHNPIRVDNVGDVYDW